ncbi:MAG: acetoacetate decarboxylase family protein [Candidatus Limiplasma sp.]|nr:acetoacetate decarboxylase family protein [Candidatus Limiplasma sp.]
MQTSYFVPAQKLAGFMDGGAMNSQEGLYLFGIADPSVKRLLPPPLELADDRKPMFYVYIVNIREPTFAPWYLEGGIGVMARYKERTGLYFFNLQLSGPGALMGAFAGREASGLPKKLCQRIVVERTDARGHCCIERDGVRLVDVELEIGRYNDPSFHVEQEGCQEAPGGILTQGGCLLHKYRLDGGFKDMELIYYDSPTRYYAWEPAAATLTLASSPDDPWGDIPVVSVLGAGWAKCDNSVRGTSLLYRYPQDPATALDTMQYLYAGRYDRSLLCRGHQRYETN